MKSAPVFGSFVRERSLFVSGCLLVPLVSGPPASLACPFIEPDFQETIAVTTNGAPVHVEIQGYRGEDEPTSCIALAEVPLSSSPSAGHALRPADVARSIRDAAAKMGAEQCVIYVQYANDTNARFEPHELCVVEHFAFTKRDHRSVSREEYCWTPEESETLAEFE